MEIRKVYVLSEPTTVLEIAKVYKNAFGGPPWNEGYLCPVCGQIFPLSTQWTICPSCLKSREERLVSLVEYWPIGKVMDDFYKENTKKNAVCLVAENQGQVLGFVWGYGMELTAENALRIEAPELRIIWGEVFYLDECAVLPEFQGQGVGKPMVKKILSEQPYDIMILRTLEGSVMQRLIESLGGEKIMTITKGRIIMKIVKTTSLHKFVIPDHY